MGIGWLDKDKTPQDKGRRFEKRVAKRLGVKPQPGSGSVPLYKEDIETDNELLQLKSTGKKQITIKLEDLNKLMEHAIKRKKQPVMLIELGGKTWAMTPWSSDGGSK